MSEKKQYIEVKEAEQYLRGLADKKLILTGAEYANGICYAACHMKDAPKADVLPAADVSDAVDEAIRVLNAIQSSGSMDYGDYCELHDVITAILPREESEEAQQ